MIEIARGISKQPCCSPLRLRRYGYDLVAFITKQLGAAHMEETNETTAVHARFREGSIYKCTHNYQKDPRFGGHDAVFTHESASDLCDSDSDCG